VNMNQAAARCEALRYDNTLGNRMNMQAIEAEMARQMIFMIAVSVIASAIGLWITYLVIKAAIRDGIKESGLAEALRYRPQSTTPPPVRSGFVLPDMRAD
jgi:hypothetical protein